MSIMEQKMQEQIEGSLHQQEAHHQNIDIMVSKFENGEERYRNSAMFNKVIQLLARGMDSITVLDQVLKANEEQSKAFEEYMKLAPMPKRIIPIEK